MKTSRLIVTEKGIYKRPFGLRPIGYITASKERPNVDEIVLAYNINGKERKKGYATEALIAKTKEVLSKNKIPIIQILEENLASQAVAKKAGYFCYEELEWSKDRLLRNYTVEGLASDLETKQLISSAPEYWQER